MTYYPRIQYSVKLPEDIEQQLSVAVEKGLSSRRSSEHAAALFFRADDIGVPSAGFTRLIELFQKYETPLCLAVVPSWLTKSRLAQLQTVSGKSPSLWCWHQHGRLHRNYEQEGKKQEYGPARPKEIIYHDLKKGKERLELLLRDDFAPFFTPPWNRCCKDALISLKELGFKAVSRSDGAKPAAKDILPDISVNVDLHTRKQGQPDRQLNGLLKELEQSLSTGLSGVMIHHQRMHDNDFIFLDILLSVLRQQDTIQPVTFSQLLDSGIG